MNPETMLPLLADLLLKSTAVFALAALTLLFWRGASAASRHMVWLAAFLLLLLLPFTKFATPRWSFGFVGQTPQAPEVKTTTAQSARNFENDIPDKRQPGGSGTNPGWQYVALAAWTAGTILLLAYRVAGSLQLRRLARQSRAVSSERTLQLARQIAETNGFRVELRESGQARVPMTWGARHPMILLPEVAAEWSDAQLTAALLHEAGHIQRHDYVIRLFAQIACAVYWMNPLPWLAARQLRLAQELACDDLVLRSGMNAGEYADQLINVVRSLQSAQSPAPRALAMAHASTLETRVRAIVEPGRNRQPPGRGMIAVSVTAAAAILFLVSLAQIGAADSPVLAAGNKEKGQTITALVEKIRPMLPAGWKVSYDTKRNALVVERNEDVPQNKSDMPNGPGYPEGEKPPVILLHFSIVYDIEPYTLTDTEYARFKAENVEIQKRLDAKSKGMRHIDHKFDSFIPRTESEKKQVATYNQLKATLHDLPDYRYRDISLVYYDPFFMRGDEPYSGIVDATIRKECEKVYKNVIALFTKYKEAD